MKLYLSLCTILLHYSITLSIRSTIWREPGPPLPERDSFLWDQRGSCPPGPRDSRARPAAKFSRQILLMMVVITHAAPENKRCIIFTIISTQISFDVALSNHSHPYVWSEWFECSFKICYALLLHIVYSKFILFLIAEGTWDKHFPLEGSSPVQPTGDGEDSAVNSLYHHWGMND